MTEQADLKRLIRGLGALANHAEDNAGHRREARPFCTYLRADGQPCRSRCVWDRENRCYFDGCRHHRPRPWWWQAWRRKPRPQKQPQFEDSSPGEEAPG